MATTTDEHTKMISEKNRKPLQTLYIIVNETDLNEEDSLQNEYKRVAQNYVKNIYSTIEQLIQDYLNKKKSFLFGITNLHEQIAGKNEDGEEKDNNQHWINFNIIKLNGKLFVFIIDSFQCKVDENEKKHVFKKLITEMIKEKIEFIDYNNQDESCICLTNIEIAFSHIEIFIHFLKNEKQEIERKFEELEFFQKNNQSIKFEKLIVEQGLSTKIRTKPTLQKILSPLKSVIDSDSEYKLPEQDQFKMLSSILGNINFLPRDNDKIDYTKEVISILAIFKDRGQEFNEEIKKNLKKYFVENKNKYRKDIDELNNKLHENSRDKNIQGSLGSAVKNRMEFLVNMNKLSSHEINLNDIDDFMKFFDNKNEQQILENRKNQLEILNEKNDIEKSIRINDEISKIREKLDYYARISEISNKMNFNDLIILLGEKIELIKNSEEFSFSQETINKILEIGKKTENNQVALAIVKIFLSNNCEQNIEEIEQVLENVLPKIPQEKTEIVLMLFKKLRIVKNSSLLVFLHKILIENENAKERKEALEILKSFKINSDNLKYISETIKLEEKCLENDQSIVKDCLEHVKMKNKLTLNCFEELKKYFHKNEISEIIREIVEHEIQKLPKFFINQFREYTKSLTNKDNQMNIIRISKWLIKSKQMKLEDIEELINNYESFNNEIFDLLLFQYQNGYEISKDILDKVQIAGKTNEYARNLIKLMEKTSTNIDILKNPRNSLEERQNALKKIVKDKQYYTLDTIKLLESLIKYDTDLRIDAFIALITILPNNFSQTKDFKIDLIEIGKCIEHDQNISINDITSLIYKDKTNENFAGIIPVIINRITNPQVSVNDANRALELLTEISGIKQNGNVIIEKLQYLLKIASNTTNNKLRENIIRIIENSINKNDQNDIKIVNHEVESSLADELRKLANLQILKLDINSLEILEKNIEHGYTISEDKINLLIENLIKPNQQDVCSKISEILFKINLRQGFNNTNINQIIKNPKLLDFVSIIGIVAVALNRDIQFPDELIQTLWEQLLSIDGKKDQKLKSYLIYATAAIVNQQNSLPINVLEKIGNFLTDKTDPIETRLLCVQILSKEIKQNLNYSKIIDSLKQVALDSRMNKNDDLLNKFVFEILEKFIEENDFLQKYYTEFRTRIIDVVTQKFKKKNFVEELKPLDDIIFIDQNITTSEKFHLLCALNNTLLNREIIDTNIFKQFPINEWRKEILCSELLVGTFKLINLDDGVNEFEITKFRNYIRLIDQFILTQNTEIYSIENLLQILIDKQNLYQLPLEIINDILLMLYESNETKALNIIIDHHDFQMSCVELRELWLEKQLNHFNIESKMEEVKELNKYLPYKSEIVDFVLNKLHELTTIDELIDFFIKLSNCGLTRESIEYFLSNETTNKINLNHLKFKLDHRLVCVLLNNKFPNYAQYFNDHKHYHLITKSKSFVSNAYNQANTTHCYNAKDIAQISSEWMKQFSDQNIRITQPLDQQNDKNLSTILIEILNQYKQDKKFTIIPLNIADIHWVTLALIYNNNKQEHIALYKDSLGKNNLVEERENVRKILNNELKNVEFKFNQSCEQFDDYNGGVFTLANMKHIAEKLSGKNQISFIDKFENYNFTTQEQAIKLRHNEFPKMYALSLLQPYKRRELVNYHSVELKFIQELLQTTIDEESKFGNEIRISIRLPKEENLLKKKDYQYLYVIEIVDMSLNHDIDFRQNSELKTKITNILGVKVIYSTEKNIIEILDQKLTIINQKKEKKIDPNELIKKLRDNEIENCLNELCVEINEYNTQVLRMHLDLIKKINNESLKNQKIFDINEYEIINKLHKKLTKVLNSGWSIKSIQQLIDHINSKEKLENLFNALDPIYEYNLKEFDNNIKGTNLINILTTSLSSSPSLFFSSNLIEEVHDLAIFQTFKGTYHKNFEQLKTDILDLNSDQKISFLQDKTLTEEYEKVLTAYKNKSEICPDFGLIENWSISNIKKWSEQLKKLQKSSSTYSISQYEIIAVVKRGVQNTSHFPPREIQLLSVLIMMNPANDTGRLAQINTGEGKTTIVAMLAAIKALERHQVDIVTSSPELAKPQSIQQKEFYQQFNLTVSHNGKDSIDIKTRYAADIVYGAASDFQGDILRDEYSKLGTRNRRKCDVAIVDEVDSMLIDGKNHIVMLSSPMPAMDHLEPLLAAIWIQIGQVANYIQEINGTDYFIQQLEDIFNDDGTVKAEVIENALPIDGSKEEFIKKATEKHIRKLIRDVEHLTTDEDKNIPSSYPEIKIPKHLRELVIESQLSKWIDSGIYAKYRCENEQHYILKDGKIAPVDANNTGIVQPNMHWNNGLHQFLQLKHGGKISPESLTTNFISNVTYFKRYRHNIYGLTGTLGSANAKKLLNKIYNVDNVIIPSFKKKQHLELTPIIVDNENDWYNNIVESSMNKLYNGRGVLIITKYIKEVDEIKNRLITTGYDGRKIKQYRTEDESKAIEDEMKPGEIIIATNIAGRGTDIRADKIEKNGGLHVLITFLPPNERVEQQNVGRTSRTGNKGTSQFILLEKHNSDYQKLKIDRDIQEEFGIHKAEAEIEKVTIKDAIFEEFCKLLTIISENKVTTSIENKIKVRAVEDRFGIWLKMQETTIITTKEEMLKKFEIFKNKILIDQKNDNLIENPYFYVLIGNEYLNDRSKNNKKAIEKFTKAIELDEHFQVNAYYNRGYARIAEYGRDCKTNENEINGAINDFKRAKQIINENFEPMLYIIRQASSSEAISEQVLHKMTLFNLQKNSIESAIGIGKKAFDDEIEELEKQKQQENIGQEDKENIGKQIENLKKNKESRQIGCIGQARQKNHDIEIEFLAVEKSLPEDQDINLYEDEIREYKNNGFRGNFTIKEIKPIDWWSVICVAALGLAQLVGGAALAVFTLGAGASIGLGLITEGIGDLITAVKDGIINRDFSWVSYGIQKAISLTVSLVCAGLSGIKDVAKTAVAGVKSIGSVMTTTVKAGWKIAAKAIGTGLAKGIATELVTQLVDYGVSKTLMPAIQDQVMQRIEGPIQNALLANSRVKKMLELDGKNRNCRYESLIRTKAMELLNSNTQKNALMNITVNIAKGIAAQKVKGVSTLLKANDFLQALNELATFLPNFIEKLNQAIDQLYEEQKIDEQEAKNENNPQQQQQKVDQKNTLIKKQENKAYEKEEINQINSSNHIQETSREDIDIKNVKEQEQIKLDRTGKTPDVLCQSLAASVSINMCNIIQHKLIKPVTKAGTDYGMKTLTSGIDQQLQDEMSNLKAERRVQFYQDKDKNNRIQKKVKQGKEKEAADAKANKMINDLKTGGEAGLPHLGPLSDAANRPIKVLDENGQLVCIIGEDKEGKAIEVEYHKPNENNPSGHWTLPGGKEPFENDTGNNNCLFNVIGKQTGQDPTTLRQDTARMMENDKENLVNQADDINRLEQYKKDALAMGGAIYTPGKAQQVLQQSQNVRPFGSTKRGHARDHVGSNMPGQLNNKQTHTMFLNPADQDACLEGIMKTHGTTILSHLQNTNTKRVEVHVPLPNPISGIEYTSGQAGQQKTFQSAVLFVHNPKDATGSSNPQGDLHVQSLYLSSQTASQPTITPKY